MRVRRVARIVIETAHRYDSQPSSHVQKRKTRAAYCAEYVREPLGIGQLVGVKKILALRIAKRLKRNEEIRCECSSADLAAPLAMAIVSPYWLSCEFVTDRSAKTATCDHMLLHAEAV